MQKQIIKRVVAGVLYQNGKYLLCQRSKVDANYEKWEFPGGKVEEGETDQDCLKRELFEELGITPVVGDYICTVSFEHNNQPMEMAAYFVFEYQGVPFPHEHKQLVWVAQQDFAKFIVPDPDIPIINHLQNNLD